MRIARDDSGIDKTIAFTSFNSIYIRFVTIIVAYQLPWLQQISNVYL